MAVIADMLVILEGNITAGLGGGIVRSESSYTTGYDIPRIPIGETRFQIQWGYTGKERGADSNIAYHGYQITVWVHHRLASAANENAYMQGSPDTPCESAMRLLGDPAFWKIGASYIGTNPGFYDFQRSDDALVLTDPERDGNVISFSARAKILLNA